MLKKRFVCKNIDNKAAKGPNIRFFSIKISAYKKLWRSILKCASVIGELVIRGAKLFGKTEVSNFNITLFANKNIVWLKILNIFSITR